MALFGPSTREKDLARKLDAVESENRHLKERLAAMERDFAESREQSARMAETVRNWEQLLQNMAAFGSTLQESQNTLSAMTASLLSEAVAALTNFRYPLAEGRWGVLEIQDAPRPAFSDTHAYFPIGFRAEVMTPGACP